MLISVVVPVYKVEEYLSRCVDSILNQTFTDFELILVDDGSPDNCGKMCDEYAKSDNRVTVIHRKNGGLSAARNSGIEWAFNNSDSEWITFIDSEDWVHADYLKILLDYAQKFNTEVSICDFLRTSDYIADDVLKEKLKVHKYSSEDFFVNRNLNAVVAWGKLYKKYFFKDIRYPEGRLHEDEFTTYKVLFRCKNICFVDEVLYYYFINPESITSGNSSEIWKPGKMAFNDAVEERLIYFKEKNMDKLYLWQLEHYMYFLCDSCKYITESGNSDYKKKYLSDTRKRLRKIIRLFEKTKGKSLDKEKIWIKQTAYPAEMAVYWFFRGILERFSK